MRVRAMLLVATLAALLCACTGGSESSVPSTSAARTTTTQPPFSCDVPRAGAHTVRVGGEDRTYDLAVPASFDQEAPLIVLFHGYGSSPAEIERVTGLARSGPAAGAVVVAPLAVGSPSSWRIVQGLDADRAFVDRVIDDLVATRCVDPQRTWLAGFSAGSAFTGVYGCTRTEPVAGLVMVSGLPPALCPDSHTPRVMVVNGTADPVVDFEGGDQDVNGTKVALASIPESVAGWAERAGCTSGPAASEVGDDVALSSWTACDRGGPVDLMAIDGGGHAWPGGSAKAIGGVTTQTVSATCVLLGLVADDQATVAGLAPECPGDHPELGR